MEEFLADQQAAASTGHSFTADGETADVIIFTQAHMLGDDWRLNRLLTHPLCRAFPERAFIYDERDMPWCALPGVYVSAPASQFRRAYQAAWSYQQVQELRPSGSPDLLFSLIASPTHACREPLFSLHHPDSVVRRVEGFVFFDRTSPGFAQRKTDFANTLGRSRFVLCPRGAGTSSFRLYETLSAGRVPVIISDDWVPPKGPDWDRICIRWPERTTSGLVEALEAALPRWPAMSLAAREAFETFFSRSASHRHIIEICAQMAAAGVGERHAALRNRAIHSFHAKAWHVSTRTKRFLRKVRS